MPLQESPHPTGSVADHARPWPCPLGFHVSKYNARAHEPSYSAGVPMAVVRKRRFSLPVAPEGTYLQATERRRTAGPSSHPQPSEIYRMVRRSLTYGRYGTSMQPSPPIGRAYTID